MKCGQADAWMSLYVDRRLDMRRQSQLEAHLSQCHACQHDLALMSVTKTVLQEEPAAEEPAALTQAVMMRVSAYEARLASLAAEARQRKAARSGQRSASWQGAGVWRMLAGVVALTALLIWAQVSSPTMLPGLASRLAPNALALLAAPGPDAIAWSVWIAGAALALLGGAWLARADASEEWRRSLAERLPQLW